jgi:pimeloyl-ACP methyl ester carboxylesterase
MQPRTRNVQTESAAADMAVRPSRVAGVRLAARVAGKAALALVGAGTLEDAAAEALLRSPNAGRQARKPVAGERAIAVGPPSAVLSLAIAGTATSLGTLFLLHGIRDSKESLLGWARRLAASGYRVVLVDLRGHGHSTGDFLSYGVQESRDLVQVLDALDREGLAQGPIGAMAHSYGAATAIQWAARDARVRAIVAVAPFASLREVVNSYTRIGFPGWLVERALARASVRGAFDTNEASPADALSRTDAAVLLVHGRADRQVPAWHSERIQAARPERTELVLVDGAGHDDVAGAPRTRLAERAAMWFAAHLRT